MTVDAFSRLSGGWPIDMKQKRRHNPDFGVTFADGRAIEIAGCRDAGLARLLAAEAHCGNRGACKEIIEIERLAHEPRANAEAA